MESLDHSWPVFSCLLRSEAGHLESQDSRRETVSEQTSNLKQHTKICLSYPIQKQDWSCSVFLVFPGGGDWLPLPGKVRPPPSMWHLHSHTCRLEALLLLGFKRASHLRTPQPLWPQPAQTRSRVPHDRCHSHSACHHCVYTHTYKRQYFSHYAFHLAIGGY